MEYFNMFRQLWLYADRERWKIVVYLTLHAISMLGELGKPFAFSMVLNALQRNESTVVREVMTWLGFYLLCFFVFEIFHRSARFIERFVAFRNRKRFVNSMYSHLQSLPLSWHSDNHSGAVIDRVNKAADGLYNFGQSQSMYIQFFMNFWVPLIILWTISPIISVLAVISGLTLVVITKKLYNLSIPEYRAQNDKFHNVAAGLHDYVSNITTIIMLRLGKSAQKDIDERINRAFPHLVKENYITHIKCFIAALIMISLDVGVIFYYIYSQKQAGSVIMIGSVTVIFFYLHQCMSSFQFYSGDYEQVIHWKTDFEAIKPILDEKAKTNEDIGTNLDQWKQLNLNSLHFSYGGGKYHLKDVSINIEKGKKVAFVGASGAGKSTLLKVLRGLTPVEEGTLTKEDGSNLPVTSLSTITTLIPQEPEIFENNIHYNITMGMPGSEIEVENALRISGFKEVVARLPHGLESDVREKGVNLSGGEKQRLALARGIYSIKDSEIILLDEPTSNVDPAVEMTIFKRLFEHLSDRSVISVLHRLHLVRHFDYVYVFKQGEIVEEGTFEALHNAKGEFARLWEKYLAEEEVEVEKYVYGNKR
ncbi:ABC transporter ATP-binding protein [Bacillus sp. SM2101]|uniref:ABC transporter ATP-binding protein n=1 Tax=Bacillus sp. SM2101 TaxID=2805366 RepID=UPI001BDECF17|nr:ABC transporter ATP-binding protein [Bacillus sp. SM2101]